MEYKPKGKPRINSVKELKMPDGTIIGVFEGNRGYIGFLVVFILIIKRLP